MSFTNNELTEDCVELQRRVALAGPGYQGRRQELSPDDASELSEQLAAHSLTVPFFLKKAVKWVDREAKLFEAGDFPDRGLSFSATDLKQIEENFDLPVSVLVEHAHSPLHLGYLTSVRSEGNELYGTITLTEEANRLLDQSGAGSLSVGLSEALDAIQEVSVVRKPQIEGARLFSGELLVSTQPNEGAWLRVVQKLYRLAEGNLELKRALKQAETGQLVPANLFHELAPQPSQSSHATFLPEEVAFYERYFPGVDLEAIARCKR